MTSDSTFTFHSPSAHCSRRAQFKSIGACDGQGAWCMVQGASRQPASPGQDKDCDSDSTAPVQMQMPIPNAHRPGRRAVI